MPLFDETPSNAPVEPVKEIVIDTTTVYQGDTTVPTGTTLSGSPWVLKAYYSQYMSKDDYPRLIDFKLDPTLQQYVEIENFVLLMTESFSQDEDDNHISTIKGTATFYPGIVPNQWDMMVGPMSDGSMGVFTIPDVPKRAKYHKYTSHTAVIEFIGYYDEVYAEQFRIKSVDRLVFDPDNPGCPAKNIKEVETKQGFVVLLQTLLAMLYDEYYDITTRTLLLNDKENRAYDPNAVRFLRRILGRDFRGRYPLIEIYETPDGNFRDFYQTIFDVMSDAGLHRWDLIGQKSVELSPKTFHSSHMAVTLFLTDIRSVIMSDEFVGETPLYDRKWYVFGEAFYTQKPEAMDSLERSSWNALNKQAPILADLTHVTKSLRSYTHSERFYRLLALIWLVIFKLRSR